LLQTLQENHAPTENLGRCKISNSNSSTYDKLPFDSDSCLNYGKRNQNHERGGQNASTKVKDMHPYMNIHSHADAADIASSGMDYQLNMNMTLWNLKIVQAYMQYRHDAATVLSTACPLVASGRTHTSMPLSSTAQSLHNVDKHISLYGEFEPLVQSSLLNHVFATIEQFFESTRLKHVLTRDTNEYIQLARTTSSSNIGSSHAAPNCIQISSSPGFKYTAENSLYFTFMELPSIVSLSRSLYLVNLLAGKMKKSKHQNPSSPTSIRTDTSTVPLLGLVCANLTPYALNKLSQAITPK
jgi:hypothetical protein